MQKKKYGRYKVLMKTLKLFLSEFVYTVRSVDRGQAILSCMISG